MDVSNGVVLRVLERIHESGQVSQEQVGNMHRAALDILAAAFAVPGCPLVADKRLVDFYVHYHFLNFVKLYHTMRGAHHLALARGHLAVLAALSGHKGGHMVRRFFQLRVCDFLVRELSLEFECHAAGAAQPWGSRPSSSRPTNRSAISSARSAPLPSRPSALLTLRQCDVVYLGIHIHERSYSCRRGNTNTVNDTNPPCMPGGVKSR